MLKLSLVGGLLLIAGILAVSALGLSIYFSLTIPQSGNVQAPANVTASPSTISWSDMNMSSTYTTTIDLTNNGDQPITLNMTYDTAPQIAMLTWSYEGMTLQPHTTETIEFTLTTSTTTGLFSSNIYINEK